MIDDMEPINFEKIPVDEEINITAAAREYGLRQATLSKWARDGVLPSRLDGRTRYVVRAHVQAIAKRWDEVGGQGKRIFEKRD